MARVFDASVGLLEEVDQLVARLGVGGGLITPSVYDTAHVARFAPPVEGADPAIAWLKRQQGADGGWGSPDALPPRHTSTLAAMLALASHNGGGRHRDAVTRGARYLRETAEAWHSVELDDLPVAAELGLRRLLLDAAEIGLDVENEAYGHVVAIGERKLEFLRSRQWPPGCSAIHTWETWGTCSDLAHQSVEGDIGTSPGATARWLAGGVDGPEAARAHAYLRRAARATRMGIPGVVPGAYPIDRMEQIFGLLGLAWVGDQWLPTRAAHALGDELEAAYVTRGGASHTDEFEIDGDDTGAAAGVLNALGRRVDPRTLRCFERDDHFYTYGLELNPSATVTARCVRSLALLGEPVTSGIDFLLSGRGDDGLWHRDKWHTSWCYVTAQCVAALCATSVDNELPGVASAICARQRADGGFGAFGRSTVIETAYAVLALALIEGAVGTSPRVRRAWRLSTRYLEVRHRAGGDGLQAPSLWMAKEPYGIPRIDRGWELAALLVGRPGSAKPAPRIRTFQEHGLVAPAESRS